MFTNIVQPNMNGIGSDSSTDSIFAQNFQTSQDSLDANSFIKILAAILSGLNDAAIDAGSGLFADKGGYTIDFNELANSLFIDSKGDVVVDQNLAGILQQMMSQMQMIGIPKSVIAINQDNQKTVEVPNNLTSQIHSNISGNTIVSFVMKSEDRMQKGKVHTTANSDGNALLQIKAMANTLNGQEFRNIIPKDEAPQPLQKAGLQGNPSASDKTPQFNLLENISAMSRNSNIGNDQHMHTTMIKRGLESNLSTLNKDGIESAVNISDAKTHLVVNEKDRGMIAPASQLYNTPYAKNDSAIVVKEPIHVSRLNELGEVMAKTIKADNKHLIIKLEPPDLGSIQIKLRIDNGMLRADLKVDSPVVRDLFSLAIPQIKTSLEDSGIKVSDFFVDVRDDYYSDGRRQQDDTDQQNKQNKKQGNFFDYFA